MIIWGHSVEAPLLSDYFISVCEGVNESKEVGSLLLSERDSQRVKDFRKKWNSVSLF